MKEVDNFDNLNDRIIEIEAHLVKDELNKELLIQEAFILWYVLVERGQCKDFSEDQLLTLLYQNYEKYTSSYEECGDYTFIFGWILSVAFWMFDSSLPDESYGNSLLLKAYKKNKKNGLFKWAVRDELQLNNSEIWHLQKDITENFDQYYNHAPIIKDYFLSLMKMKL